MLEEDLIEIVQYFDLKLETEIPGANTDDILNTILNPSMDSKWKFNYKGGCIDIFFLTTLEKAQQFIQIMHKRANIMKYPTEDIGIYIQPQHQGISYHCGKPPKHKQAC